MSRGFLSKDVYFPNLYVEKNAFVLERLDKLGKTKSANLRSEMVPLKDLNLSKDQEWDFLNGRKLRGRSRSTLIFKKEITPPIAQLLGFIITDGSLSSTEGRIKLCQRELELILEYLSIINSEFRSELTYSFDGKEANVGSIPLRYILHKYYGIPLGKKVRIVEVPSQIIDSNDENVLKRFIAGLFDGDGYVQYYYLKNKNMLDHANFCISTSSHKLVEESINILNRLGIECSKLVREDDKRMTLQTSGFENSFKFYRQIIPFISHKKRKQIADKIFLSQDFIEKLTISLNKELKDLFNNLIKANLANELINSNLRNLYIKSVRSVEAWTYPSNNGKVRGIYAYKACKLLGIDPNGYLPKDQLNIMSKLDYGIKR